MLGRSVITATICAAVAVGSVPERSFAQAPLDDVSGNVMFIFDASGSMRANVGKETRIAAAKRAFGDTMKAMPEKTRVGLIAFGHRKRKDCSDLEVVSPIAADRPQTLAGIVSKFEALGETPIADAIERAGDAMRAFAGQSNSIVLVTDGIEECGGDPCAAAKRLVDLGVDVKVHVIGFALGAGQGDKLQCITKLTGGTYYDASDAARLASALAEVRQRVAQVEAPKRAERKSTFLEDFNGSDLSRDVWEVLNENKEFYIVENGELMMAGPAASAFSNPETMNIFRLHQDLPNGNWDIVIDAKIQTQTGADNVLFGLHTDDKNYLVVRLVRETDLRHALWIARVSGEQTTASHAVLSSSRSYHNPPGGLLENQDAFAKVLAEKGVRLVIAKRERRYMASVEVRDWRDRNERPRNVATQEVTSLRVPGRFAMATGKLDAKQPGESIAFVEKVEIFAVE